MSRPTRLACAGCDRSFTPSRAQLAHLRTGTVAHLYCSDACRWASRTTERATAASRVPVPLLAQIRAQVWEEIGFPVPERVAALAYSSMSRGQNGGAA